MTRPITCCGTGEGNPPTSIHPPGGKPPVLGYLSWEAGEPEPRPSAPWGYICEACTAAWDARRAANPAVHPRNLLSLTNPPRP